MGGCSEYRFPLATAPDDAPAPIDSSNRAARHPLFIGAEVARCPVRLDIARQAFFFGRMSLRPGANGIGDCRQEIADVIICRMDGSQSVKKPSKPNSLRAVELFAGIGGFRLAADALGLETVWANDISPLACQVYRDRFGSEELRQGDFASFRDELPPHDFLTGGFPCQPFSSAGKKEGIRDARGTLFQHIVDVLNAHRPRHFVLENVKRLLTMERGAHFATILGALARLDYVVEWRLLNAMHFGLAQNRQRVFLLGTRIDHDAEPHTPGTAFARLAESADFADPETVAAAIAEPARWRPIERHKARFETWGMARFGQFFAAEPAGFSQAQPLVTLQSVLENAVAPEFDFTEATSKWIDRNTPVNRFVQGVEILSNQRGGARMGYTIFGTAGVAPTLTSTTSRHYERYKSGDRYRRLTPTEYARLQGFPDDHCRAVSAYESYALYGNAVPPPMARWAIASALGLR
jgi:DNA (cytosine-5)-methyltransferase 1